MTISHASTDSRYPFSYVGVRAANVLSLLEVKLSPGFSTSTTKCIYDIDVMPLYSNLAARGQSTEAYLKPIVNSVSLAIER